MTVQTSEKRRIGITPKEVFSVLYHDKFDYPLKISELQKWKLGNYLIMRSENEVDKKGDFIFLKGRKEIVTKRLLREKISDKKIKFAMSVAKILGKIPTIKMIGLTGSLAMKNADTASDIDFLIVTQNGTLWTTRILTYLALALNRYKTRKPNDNNQKDKLCLNIWLDEKNLVWRKRNIFTAHEIAQVVPLLNKGKTFEKFIEKNIWAKNYWPNALVQKSAKSFKSSEVNFSFSILCFIFEPIAYVIQYLYMRPKMTREKVNRSQAIFHPVDWSNFVIRQLSS